MLTQRRALRYVCVHNVQNTRKMSQSGPENCCSRWKFADTFRKFLSTKCKTRERCHSLDLEIVFALGIFRHFRKFLSTKCKTRERCHSFDLEIVFRVGNFETLFEIVCQQNALHEKNVAVWAVELFFALEIFRHFSKVSVSEMQNTKQMSQSGPEIVFHVGNFQTFFESLYQ